MPLFPAHFLHFATEPWYVVASTGQFAGNVFALCTLQVVRTGWKTGAVAILTVFC